MKDERIKVGKVEIKMKKPKLNTNVPSLEKCTKPCKSTPNMSVLQDDMKISKVDIGKGVKEKYKYDYQKDIFETNIKSSEKSVKKKKPKKTLYSSKK